VDRELNFSSKSNNSHFQNKIWRGEGLWSKLSADLIETSQEHNIGMLDPPMSKSGKN